MQLSNIKTITTLLEKHGMSLSKSLGQNFLVNPSVCPKIAELGGAKDVGVIEIGTGIGVLTAELAKLAKKVVAVELDTRLFPVLAETLSEFNNVKIINNDIMKTDVKKLIQDEFENMDVVVCANLPYYITSPIIMMLLESRLRIKSITVMVQKEAAVRLCAMPGTRDVGAISIAVRYFSNPQILFNVSRGSFYPPPNVDSCVIKLNINNNKFNNVENEAFFFKIVKAAFSMRRKTLVNCLSSGLSVSKEEVQKTLETACIKVTARAEELKMEQFIEISNIMYKMSQK